MYRAKDNGRNTYQFFTSELNQRMQEQLRLETMLRGALDRGEFDLEFQPQIALASGEPVGFEALLRWNPPDRGPIPPAVFVPILEDTGLIAAVGDWALRRACLWAAEWRRHTGMQTTLAVNLSPRQFKHGGLVQALQGALAHSGWPPELLELEITEGVLLDPDDSLRVINQIKQVGVRLALDDFGTGYSSLAYLKRYPIDRLKIDRSFVRDITIDQDDATIAAAIIGLAHNLGLRVIAEGVENEEQRRFLHERGCDEVQGYLFARPMGGMHVAQWWRERTGGAAPRLRSCAVQFAAVKR
jgi:EAL domain-containing protein (putative c-di-GMP-specific phosphodiesterase class I)